MPDKRIHFIRHGQSEHNARFEAADDELAVRHDPCLRDAPLSALGQQQARALGDEVKALRGIELVVVSPLSRAFQTTLAAHFNIHPDHPQDTPLNNLFRSGLMDRNGCFVANLQVSLHSLHAAP
ncbi:MAG: phosphoglycerate mutase family protein [Kiritimatiellia bacterium]